MKRSSSLRIMINTGHCKDVSEMKCTNWLLHYLTTLSGHILANYINIFLKTEFFLNILRAKRVLILIGWELQDKKKTIFCVCLFQFCKKENEIFWIISGHFTTISGHFSANYSTIFHKSKVQTVILKYLVYLYLN